MEEINNNYQLKVKLKLKQEIKSINIMEKKQIVIIAGEKGTQIYNLKTLKLKKISKKSHSM